MQNNRLEKDTMGEIAVPNERLWGAQTQRSLEHFKISHEKMPPILLKALAYIKQAAAKVNGNLHLLPDHKVTAIIRAADEVIQQQHLSEFPLVIWQTGSGTQTNMNMNEVIANRASELLGGKRGTERLVHPNDDVNMSQSSNDVFPAAMHIAAVMSLQPLLAALSALQMTFEQKASHYHTLVKIGRTHLQDATPLTLGQEISGWNSMLQYHEQHIQQTFSALYELALGGTAVGTGLNAPKGYADAIAKELAVLTQLPFMSAPNKFSALAGCDALVNAHSALKGLATALMKIANDIRWLASGPRCGIGELTLPENEPGSSIMPGKVNPTQCEALTMLCVQIMGNDVAIGMGGASGNFELNVFRPMIIHNFLQSMRLLTDGLHSFNQHCAMGMMANEGRIQQLLNESLMLVTALSPHIGYDKAAAIAKKAHQDNLTLKQAAVLLGWVTEAEFHQWVNPKNMVGLDEC